MLVEQELLPFKLDPFWKGFVVQGSKQEVTKVVPLCKNGEKKYCNHILIHQAHTCHKLWAEICEIRQNFKWDFDIILWDFYKSSF